MIHLDVLRESEPPPEYFENDLDIINFLFFTLTFIKIPMLWDYYILFYHTFESVL